MQKRFLPALFAAAFLLIVIGYSCTKIDNTTLGGDLLAIDNLNTKADTLDVDVTQGIFTNDSTLVQKTDNMVVGKINDPLFGTTDAALYVQFKPIFYPFYFGNPGDKVYPSQSSLAGLDSAFICLSYKGAYGDTNSATTIGQTFEVRQITDDAFRLNTDTLRKVTYQRPGVASGAAIGTAVITPQSIAETHIAGHAADSSVTNQIRIRLDQGWATSFFNIMDSTTIQPNNGLNNDTMFRKNLKGFEIRVKSSEPGGNTLFYVNLAEAKSRLEFYYRKVNSANVVSSGNMTAFQFYTTSSGTTASSSVLNSIQKTYNSGVTTAVASSTPANVYLDGNPGTFINVKVPKLTNYSNRIIHRAYLVMEQTPDNPVTDGWFNPPPYVYLDLKDTVTTLPQRYKPLYFDLNNLYPYNPDVTIANGLYHPYPASNVDASVFGGVALNRNDGGGVAFSRYEMNITRYVQHIVSNGYHNYDFRVYAPYSYAYPQYTGVQYTIPYFNPLSYGRVRVAAGKVASSSNPHYMRVIVVYSEIK